MASAIQFVLGRLCHSTAACEKKLAGIRGTARPRKSRTCENAMMMAMPVVNPVTIATGMKRTSVPMRKAPMVKRSSPAIMVAMSRFAMPYFSAMP